MQALLGRIDNVLGAQMSKPIVYCHIWRGFNLYHYNGSLYVYIEDSGDHKNWFTCMMTLELFGREIGRLDSNYATFMFNEMGFLHHRFRMTKTSVPEFIHQIDYDRYQTKSQYVVESL
jgi:hypothetical protein